MSFFKVIIAIPETSYRKRTKTFFFYKKVKSGPQVLKSSKNPFFFKYSDKNKFKNKLNCLSWSSVQKIGVPVFFFFLQ